jgi:hypothetical protein
MRILGYIPHPIIKITVMVMNDKLVLKLEFDLLEQTYKIRTCDEIPNFDAVEKLVDEPFLNQCIERFKSMQQDLYQSFERNIKQD